MPRIPPRALPDESRCLRSSLKAPNDFVWANRREDIRITTLDDGSARFWSPSTVLAGEKILLQESSSQHPDSENEMSLRDWVYGTDLHCKTRLEDEPAPRKLRVWPVLTMKDWSEAACPDELRGIVDESVILHGPKNCKQTPAHPDAENTNLNSQERAIIELAALYELFKPARTIPKLEQQIPARFLPAHLFVHDPRMRTGRTRGAREPLAEQYIRVIPKPDTESMSLGKLDIPAVASVGEGHHARVFQANLTLDDRFTMLEYEYNSTHPTRTWGRATVQLVAKISDRNVEDMEMLRNEAAVYERMIAHLSEHWSGYNAAPGAWKSEEDAGFEREVGNDVRIPATAAVGQFYGYYVPKDAKSTSRPLILLENCGQQIDFTPHDMTPEDKMTCATLINRVSAAGITQGSAYARNFLIQTGPLTLPPILRSFAHPSFRLIDFGRAEHISPDRCTFNFALMSEETERRARLELAMALDAVYGGTRRRRYY
ncbi:hypothetical protein HMN09_00944000 [Mycena chlorophos]|uniref:Protein kinase domain-containing protein n=1 Tax=Mycena chlorophos TaxID=658473 RepID=A0A8H6SJ13_MYCCL|nr:hypothetical protein HMN09_00944000 [Mycena chlorophos]